MECSNGAVKTVFDIQVDGKRGPGRSKMTWKQLTERDCREWKLSVINAHDRHTWRSGVRSAMRAASQLSGRGPTDVDVFLFFFLETKIFIFYIPVTNIFHDLGNHESFSSSFTLPISHLKCALLNYSLYCPDSLESVNMYTNVKVFIFCKQCTFFAVTHTF